MVLGAWREVADVVVVVLFAGGWRDFSVAYCARGIQSGRGVVDVLGLSDQDGAGWRHLHVGISSALQRTFSRVWSGCNGEEFGF